VSLIILPEIALKRVLDYGIVSIKENDALLYSIFQYYQEPINAGLYSTKFMQGIHKFIHEYDIPVIQGWTLNDQVVPCYSIASTSISQMVEDEAIGSVLGDFEGEGLVGEMMLNYNLDIGIHTTKTQDHSIWLHTILIYILYHFQPLAYELGLLNYTFVNTPISKEMDKTFDSIYSRHITLSCTVMNSWEKSPFVEIDEVIIRLLKERAF
jgi:hypothetical protein